MAENLSWIGNQPNRYQSLDPSNIGIESGPCVASRSKPKQPFLRKGSGNVQRRLAASKERKYVPKGGFLKDCVTLPSEVGINHSMLTSPSGLPQLLSVSEVFLQEITDETSAAVKSETCGTGFESLNSVNSGEASSSNLQYHRKPLTVININGHDPPFQEVRQPGHSMRFLASGEIEVKDECRNIQLHLTSTSIP